MREDRDRKLGAERFNEHAKLLATFFNAPSIATLGAAFIVPIAQDQYALLKDGHWILIPAALALHLAGHAAIRLRRSEA